MHSNTIYPASPLILQCTAKSTSNFLLLPFCIKLQVSRQITFLYFVLMVCIHVLKVFFSLPEETLYLFKLSSQPTHIKKKVHCPTFCCMAGAHHPPSNLHVNKLALHHHTKRLLNTTLVRF